MTRFDVARTQQPKSTAAYGSLRFGPLRYQLKRTIGMLPTPDNSECSRQPGDTRMDAQAYSPRLCLHPMPPHPKSGLTLAGDSIHAHASPRDRRPDPRELPRRTDHDHGPAGRRKPLCRRSH
ncbi:hypothetical protein [Tateyamaria sp.]|uniref:hypothetical protein n=1 Tax=Tateyamaria sp. TaxID=1929288 RepID=UPI003B2142B8